MSNIMERNGRQVQSAPTGWIWIRPFLMIMLVSTLLACVKQPVPEVAQWRTIEIELVALQRYQNPYTDVEVWAVFQSEEGDSLVRPAYWAADNVWKIRFAPPAADRVYTWTSYASHAGDAGLHGQRGQLRSVAAVDSHPLYSKGLMKMSPGKRSVVHHSGQSFLLVGDTPWALPFRATTSDATTYAQDRSEKGFNAALLMTVQPDQGAEGPDQRGVALGFARGFTDLHEGHIDQIVPAYFDYLDTLTGILIDHGVVPVYQPIFHGFGWKGKEVLGNVIDPEAYVRYCKYLLARYGSRPAFWLIAGDNGGDDPGVFEAGIMLEQWDCYQQPTGLHYNPCDDYVADWALNNPLKHCEHYNKTHQEQDWLDFQWAQTGHGGEHLYHKVERMYDNLPTKASANGEPTYEGMNDGKNGLGWWQGEEAWMQWMSGGTMGVVYGAAGLWQWKITAEEPGWTAWASQAMAWHQAMEMEGAAYVGQMSHILADLDLTDIAKRWDLAGGTPLLTKEGLHISYLSNGGPVTIDMDLDGHHFRWANPKTGEVHPSAPVQSTTFQAPSNDPWVLIIHTV